MKKILFCLLLALTGMCAHAEVHSQDIEYGADRDKTRLRGYLVWDDRFSEPLPGVIAVHEWWGLNDYIKLRARQLARMGYVVLAVDMYGEGRQARHPKQAGQWSSGVRADPDLTQARFTAAMDLLSAHDKVTDEAVSAIGYCFGGSIVLDMAIRGLPLKGVASFHGGLSGLSPFEREISAKVRVFHGNQDSFIGSESVEALDQGMREYAGDYQFFGYDGAVHSFTNPQADALSEKFDLKGIAYDRRADADSWARLALFLAELYR